MNHTLLLVKLLREPLRGSVLPSRDQGLPDGRLSGARKVDLRRPPTSPRPAEALEDVGLSADVRSLLVGRELDYSPVLFRTEGCEDLAPDPEVGMAHVRAFRRFGKAERLASEFVGCHEIPSSKAGDSKRFRVQPVTARPVDAIRRVLDNSTVKSEPATSLRCRLAAWFALFLRSHNHR